jgi:peptidoglycan pentaglycine glycine transferase (the first glycine)
MPEITTTEWKQFLAGHPSAHLLQSAEWGQLKSSFGWQAIAVLEAGCGAQILFRQLPLGFTFAYLPKGPVSSAPPGEAFWAAVDRVCLSRRAVFLKVEPDGWEDQVSAEIPDMQHFVTSPQHIQPLSTLVIDLQGSEEQVFDRMKPKTRYNIRLAGRKEVCVISSTDLDKFYYLMTTTGMREKFHVHSKEYYQRAYELFHPGGDCELFVAEYQGMPLATLMVFAFGSVAYYFYGASSDEERNRKATYPLQWEAIRWAHARGCLEYDMWGIPDDARGVEEDDLEGREDGLWGVYRFKRGFGGSIRRARKTMDRVYLPLLYKFYLWRYAGSGTD